MELFHSLNNNQYFDAGFGLAIFGVGIGILRKSTNILYSMTKKYFSISMEITSSDSSFPWVLQWVEKSSNLLTNHITANTYRGMNKYTSHRPLFAFSPSPGQHIMFYKNKVFLVDRNREKTSINIQTGVPFESVKFTTFGRKKEIFRSILNDSLTLATKLQENKTIIYKTKGYMWEQFGSERTKRPMASVILDKSISEEILFDLESFKKLSSWYHERGIPYRRTYLLHGPPGSGKTSYITALAGHISYDLSIINLGEPITDDQLVQSLSTVPPNSIVIMEDIDSIFIKRINNPVGYKHEITFSGLLNVLDGVLSTEERIIFMTTNHLEKLDKALIRPGRVDVIKYFGAASEFQIKQLFLRFYPKEISKANEFVDKVKNKGISMAELQGYFMMHKDNCDDAIDKSGKFNKK